MKSTVVLASPYSFNSDATKGIEIIPNGRIEGALSNIMIDIAQRKAICQKRKINFNHYASIANTSKKYIATLAKITELTLQGIQCLSR